MENSPAGTKKHTKLLQYLHTKNNHCYRHQTVDVGDSIRNYCMAFIGTMDQNILKIKTPFRNIFPLTANSKYICRGKHIFMPKYPK